MSAKVIPFPDRTRLPRRAAVLLVGYVAGFGLLVRDYVVQSRSAAAVVASAPRTAPFPPEELASEP